MAKKLNTTVHLVTDSDTGETRVLGPDSKLSNEDIDALRKSWGKRADEFLVDDGEGDDEEDPGMNEISQREMLERGGGALADSQPAESTPKIEEAMEIREEQRTDANPAGVADSEEGGPQGSTRRRSGR